MLVHESGYGLKSVITDKARSFIDNQNKNHTIILKNLIWSKLIIFSSENLFIQTKKNFQFELIHIPNFNSVLVKIYSFIVWYMVLH